MLPVPSEDEYLVPAHVRYAVPDRSESVDVAAEFVRYTTLDQVIEMVTEHDLDMTLVRQVASGELLRVDEDELPLRFQNISKFATKFLRQLSDYKSNPRTDYALLFLQVTRTSKTTPTFDDVPAVSSDLSELPESKT